MSFYPDALSAMTGLDLSSFTGRVVLAEEALPQPMLESKVAPSGPADQSNGRHLRTSKARSLNRK
jgi:hypothetical protein